MGDRSIDLGVLGVLPRSLHYAAGARVRERRKKPATPVEMTVVGWGGYVGAEAPTS